MAHIVMAAELLDGHPALDIECLDRIYLNACIPVLQSSGQVVAFMTQHLGKPIPSPALMEHIGTRFRRAAESYADANEIPWVRFGKDDRKISVMQPHIEAQAATGKSGVATIGWRRSSSGSGPPASATRRRRPRSTRSRRPTAGTCYYFYLWDQDFGPAFIKVCASAAPDDVEIIYGRQIRRNTQGTFRTAINAPRDLGCNARLPNLTDLQDKARAVNRRILEAERADQGTVLASPAFERITHPSTDADGRRTPALRFGDPRVTALAGALAATLTTAAGITSKSLRALMTGLLHALYTPGQMTYDLRRLRLARSWPPTRLRRHPNSGRPCAPSASASMTTSAAPASRKPRENLTQTSGS